MSKHNTGHSLVSDITPWWWATRQDEINRAVSALLRTKQFDFVQVNISRESLRVEVTLADQADANRIQERVNELKAALDEMVSAA